MDHIHGSYESTNRFRINPFSRQIINESEIEIAIAQYDHNSERFIFELPKMVEEHDMSLCNFIRIHYINAGKKETHKDVYKVEDLKVSEDDPDVVTFSWLISNGATSIAGVLGFAIEFTCITDDIVQYSWRTYPYESVEVPGTYDNSEAIIKEDYYDILEAWKEELFASFEDYSMDDFAKKMAGMQKISLVGITTSDLSSDMFLVGDDLISCGAIGTFTIDFKGYARLRIEGAYLPELYVDGEFVGLEYSGFVSENIQMKTSTADSVEFVDFYGIPNAISDAEADKKFETKADKLAGMQKISLVGITDIGRELTADEMITEDHIVLKAVATINVYYQGYARIRIDCSKATSHSIKIDGDSIASSSDYELDYTGYINSVIEIKCNRHNSDLRFEFYGIPDVASTDEVGNIVDEKLKHNALKASASGEVIRIDDVSASIHKAIVKVSGKNLAQFTQPIALTSGMSVVTIACNAKAPFVLSYNVTVESVAGVSGSAMIGIVYTDGTNRYDAYTLGVGTDTKTVVVDADKQIEKINLLNWSNTTGTLNWLQVEEGDTATEYEPYVDPTTVTVKSYGKNLLDVNSATLMTVGSSGAQRYGVLFDKTGTFTFSANAPKGIACKIITDGAYGDFITLLDNVNHTFELAENQQMLFYQGSEGVLFNGELTNAQLELGSNATDYEPYIEPVTYTPSADGTVEIDAIAPTMTVLTDKSGVNIDLEYQQDHNKAMGNVREDIKTLDNDLADIKTTLGDLETLLGGI